MKREKQTQEIREKTAELLKKNPAIKEALRVFEISYAQYQKALESGYSYYTDTTTSPPRMKLSTNSNRE